MSRVLNNELIYNEEDLPLQSHRRVAEFENNRGNLNGGGTAYIKIPNLRNAVLDCSGAFVKFTVQSNLIGTNLPHTDATTGDTSYETLVLSESGAVSFIRKIDIFSNSALVASIDQANKLASILSVSNNGLNSQNAKSVCDGSSLSANGDLIGNVISDTYGRFTSSVSTTSKTPEMTFCINNGILACLGESTLPIFGLKNGIELQIEFESEVRLSYAGLFDATLATTITGGTNSFSNISYVCPVIEFEDSSMEAIVSRNGFGSKDVMWSGVGHHSSIVNLTKAEQIAGGLVTKLVANNRFKSLKSLHIGAFDAPSIGSGRGSYNTPKIPFSSIQYRMNGLEYPVNKIDTISKVVQNTISCHSNNSNSVGSTFMKVTDTALNYRQSTNAGAIASVPRGVSGISLETWAETDSISGLDVSESDTEVLLNLSATAAEASLSLCFVSTYDVIYVINELGVLSASSN
tara:strand:+ start:545 stop:1930 length:1386 start_codon:yes stop_codon:yes gene_type:complete